MNKTPLKLNKKQQELLNQILSKVGDLNFKRRIIAMLSFLNIKSGDLILDMGCGEGFYSLILDRLYDCKVIGVDYDDKILDLAKGWLKGSKKVSLEIGDICNLRFKDNYFDKVICSEVLEHIDDHEKAASELYRVLKPGGILAVTVPNKNYPLLWDPVNKVRESLGLGHFNPKNGFWGGIWAYDHKRLYLPNDVKQLLGAAGFTVLDCKALTHYGVPFNHLVLYTGKSLYTSLPVPKDMRDSMEKFKWEVSDTKKSVVTRFLDLGLYIMKCVDSLNDRDFDINTSTMVVALRCKKQ